MVVTIGHADLQAQISSRGAELVALRHRRSDVLWDGDPGFWTGRSPLLFPIVGRVRDDRILVDGEAYALPQHGFARNSIFVLIETTPVSCRWALSENASTLAQYPFAFRLEVSYAIADTCLRMEATVTNTGDSVLPASFGFHPGFRWPLPGASDRDAHAITFAQNETGPVRRPVNGLLSGEAHPSPLDGHRLVLRDALFDAGALVFDQLASRSVSYAGPGTPEIRVDFEGLPHLGVWTKPGAGFICIEPWHGYADPQDFAGEFSGKPGLVMIAPGGSRIFATAVTVA
jgi:galactose mutarotase-like enzyme